MATDSDRILGAGSTVIFKDGSEHNLRFEFLGMKFLEDELGGLFGALEAFGMKVTEAKSLQYGLDTTVVFTTVAKAMACGLAHEQVVIDAGGRIRLPVFEQVENWVLMNADHRRVNTYARVGFEALIEAIPDLDKSEEEQAPADPTPAEPPTIHANGDSPGATSTSSPQFATVGQAPSSGG